MGKRGGGGGHEKTSAAAAPMKPKKGAISSPLNTAAVDMVASQKGKTTGGANWGWMWGGERRRREARREDGEQRESSKEAICAGAARAGAKWAASWGRPRGASSALMISRHQATTRRPSPPCATCAKALASALPALPHISVWSRFSSRACPKTINCTSSQTRNDTISPISPSSRCLFKMVPKCNIVWCPHHSAPVSCLFFSYTMLNLYRKNPYTSF